MLTTQRNSKTWLVWFTRKELTGHFTRSLFWMIALRTMLTECGRSLNSKATKTKNKTNVMLWKGTLLSLEESDLELRSW